jgi:hypothetical protein
MATRLAIQSGTVVRQFFHDDGFMFVRRIRYQGLPRQSFNHLPPIGRIISTGRILITAIHGLVKDRGSISTSYCLSAPRSWLI